MKTLFVFITSGTEQSGVRAGLQTDPEQIKCIYCSGTDKAIL